MSFKSGLEQPTDIKLKLFMKAIENLQIMIPNISQIKRQVLTNYSAGARVQLIESVRFATKFFFKKIKKDSLRRNR